MKNLDMQEPWERLGAEGCEAWTRYAIAGGEEEEPF